MVNYREILRLRSLGYSQRQIVYSVQNARETVRDVFALADNAYEIKIEGDISMRERHGIKARESGWSR